MLFRIGLEFIYFVKIEIFFIENTVDKNRK